MYNLVDSLVSIIGIRIPRNVIPTLRDKIPGLIHYLLWRAITVIRVISAGGVLPLGYKPNFR